MKLIQRIDALLERNTRLWMGSSAGAWFGFLRRHGLRFSPRRLHLAAAVTLISPLNSALGWLGDRLLVRSSVDAPPQPVFVIGHWRSGTTLLHQMLSTDERAIYPTTWECFAPHTSMWLSERAAGFLPLRIPASRPMDGVALSWSSPQEDEFALTSMGVPSPYEWFAFPRSFLTVIGRRSFRDTARRTPIAPALRQFLRRMASRRRRGKCSEQAQATRFVVLKSPTHSYRIDELRREFPEARFIRIRREPEAVYSSTRRLWKRLCDHQGLQEPEFETALGAAALEDHVLDAYESMHVAMDQDLRAWKSDGDDFAGRFADVEYAHIDPTQPDNTPDVIVERVAAIYARLGLGESGGGLPPNFATRLATFLRGQSGYRKNEFRELDAALRERLQRRWQVAPVAPPRSDNGQNRKKLGSSASRPELADVAFGSSSRR